MINRAGSKESLEEVGRRLDAHGQRHLLRFWSRLSPAEQTNLRAQIDSIDLPLVDRLVKTWVLAKPEAQHFDRIEPVDVLPVPAPEEAGAREAHAAGEDALRAGRVGLVLVAGGQGTRLGFPGPKG